MGGEMLMTHLYFQNRKNKRVYIEFVPDEKTGKLYLWNIEAGKMFTWEDVEEIIELIQQSMDSVDQKEINEINQKIDYQEMQNRYSNYISNNSYYTDHVLSKDYKADLHGYVVCYEDHKGYIYFDCTKKTKTRTLYELLTHLRDKIKVVHHVFEATEAKKLCAWLERLFSPGIQKYVYFEGEVPLKPYEPAFIEYLVESLKEQREFPKGIKELIVENKG
jgi:hypothetical protein